MNRADSVTADRLGCVTSPLADAAATAGTGLPSMGSRCQAALAAGGVWAKARSELEVGLCPVRPPFIRHRHSSSSSSSRPSAQLGALDTSELVLNNGMREHHQHRHPLGSPPKPS